MRCPQTSIIGTRRAGAVCAVGVCLIGVLASVVLFPGCQGCRKNATPAGKKQTKAEADKAAEKKEKPKPDFEVTRMGSLPADSATLGVLAKPGHCFTLGVDTRANNFDFRGTLSATAVDRSGHPIYVAGTQYYVTAARPVILPKGRTRQLRLTHLLPKASGGADGQLRMQCAIEADASARGMRPAAQLVGRMPGYQYLFLVLSKNPNAYNYLKQLESIRAPFDPLRSAGGRIIYYRVILPEAQQRIALPTHPLALTSLAYVLWDGVHPDTLSPAQQANLLTWLHWGGQIIINGPGTLDLFQGSFLAPYLPATPGAAVSLGPDAFTQLNQSWSLQLKTGASANLAVLAGKPLSGVRLEPVPGGTPVAGTGGLVVERRVGRGRIVATAFPLTSRAVVNWGSYDSFFNSCLLRRPARRFVRGSTGVAEIRCDRAPGSLNDARYATATRFFTRDIGAASPADAQPTLDWHLDGARPDPQAGVGGWNDQSAVAEAARGILQDAAGIKIPSAAFVARVLFIYLLILVPVNWAFFRLLRRVEWAWLAAMLIAVVGAFVVIRLAQLDIGFVRSRTELAVVELQPGCPTAHVTRFLALYSSLASRYQFDFTADPYALALPVTQTNASDREREVVWATDRDTRLTGFQVVSSRTAFVRCEQMRDIGGGVVISDDGPALAVTNRTDLNLKGVAVVRRDARGRGEYCWLGELPSQGRMKLSFQPTESDAAWAPEWYALGGTDDDSTQIDLRKLFELAARDWPLMPGEARLVGWTAQPIAGLAIRPRASQRPSRTMVLVHLRYGALPAPTPDANLLRDVRAPDQDSDALPKTDEREQPAAPASVPVNNR